MTYNACATLKWNQQTSWPVESGHGCLGCSEPNFWDAGGFYQALSIPEGDYAKMAGYAVAGGVVLGAAAGYANQKTKADSVSKHTEVSVDDFSINNR